MNIDLGTSSAAHPLASSIVSRRANVNLLSLYDTVLLDIYDSLKIFSKEELATVTAVSEFMKFMECTLFVSCSTQVSKTLNQSLAFGSFIIKSVTINPHLHSDISSYFRSVKFFRIESLNCRQTKHPAK